jgi:hypothetical protein
VWGVVSVWVVLRIVDPCLPVCVGLGGCWCVRCRCRDSEPKLGAERQTMSAKAGTRAGRERGKGRGETTTATTQLPQVVNGTNKIQQQFRRVAVAGGWLKSYSGIQTDQTYFAQCTPGGHDLLIPTDSTGAYARLKRCVR